MGNFPISNYGEGANNIVKFTRRGTFETFDNEASKARTNEAQPTAEADRPYAEKEKTAEEKKNLKDACIDKYFQSANLERLILGVLTDWKTGLRYHNHYELKTYLDKQDSLFNDIDRNCRDEDTPLTKMELETVSLQKRANQQTRKRHNIPAASDTSSVDLSSFAEGVVKAGTIYWNVMSNVTGFVPKIMLQNFATQY